jgi:hypothetical protein
MEICSPTPSKSIRALGVLVVAMAWAVLAGWATASAAPPPSPAIQGSMPAEAQGDACGPCLIVAQNSSQIGASDMDTQGMTREGIDESGFDQDGIDTDRLDTQGMTREGIDESGFDRSGIDTQGMDSEGMDRSGLSPAVNDNP